VQSGINPQCTKYAEAASGEYCSEFAPKYSITTTQLYAWNPILGANGANCGTEFQAGVYYCVGAPSTASTTSTSAPTTTSVSAPGPTQSGITSSCNKFAEAIANDACGTFATRNGITTAQLYAWNAVLGSSGQNCASSLWAGDYYCVGVSS
jgi:LysM repeat protein